MDPLAAPAAYAQHDLGEEEGATGLRDFVCVTP